MTSRPDVFDLARTGDVEGLRETLSSGTPVGHSNERGDTLLMLAAYHGREPAVRFLLEAGADPNQANEKGQAPLAGACFKGLVPVASLLIEHGADVDAAPEGQKTPLMHAAMGGSAAIVRMLLANGANPAIEAADGATALSIARIKRVPALTALLEDKLLDES